MSQNGVDLTKAMYRSMYHNAEQVPQHVWIILQEGYLLGEGGGGSWDCRGANLRGKWMKILLLKS